MKTLIRKLNSIGKQSFVENYFDYKNGVDKNTLARKLLNSNPNANTIGGQLTRISCANWIFENDLQYEALKIIKNSKIATPHLLRQIDIIINKEAFLQTEKEESVNNCSNNSNATIPSTPQSSTLKKATVMN